MPSGRQRARLFCLICILLFLGGAHLQSATGQQVSDAPATLEAPQAETEVTELAPEERNLIALRSLLSSIETIKKEIDDLREQEASAATDAEREEFSQALEAKAPQFKRLLEDLDVVATGIDIRGYEKEGHLPTDISSEFQEFMRPLVGQLKELTAKPREVEDLRSKLSQRQIEKATEGVAHIDLLLGAAREKITIDTLRTLRALLASCLPR